VKWTLTELLRELGDEQDMLGNLVQSGELGRGPFFVDKTFKCFLQNVVRGRLLSSGMSLSLFIFWHGTSGLSLNGFSSNLFFVDFFWKYVKKIKLI
jgi:hypothetical protein